MEALGDKFCHQPMFMAFFGVTKEAITQLFVFNKGAASWGGSGEGFGI